MSRFSAIVFFFAMASVYSTATAQRPAEARKIDTGLGDFRLVFKMFQECSKSQVSPYHTPVSLRSLLCLTSRHNLEPLCPRFSAVRTVYETQITDGPGQDKRTTGNGLVRWRSSGQRSRRG